MIIGTLFGLGVLTGLFGGNNYLGSEKNTANLEVEDIHPPIQPVE